MGRELVERAMHGDREAFGVLAERAIGRLTGVAGLILRDRDAADDAVQEALVRAWRDIPGLRDPDRFEGWLYRILVRACGDQVRRAKRTRHQPIDDQATTLAAATSDATIVLDRDELDRALGRLTAEHRAVVVLHYYAGLTLAEISHALGQPIGTVKSRLSRALAFLQAEVAADARVGAPREGPA